MKYALSDKTTLFNNWASGVFDQFIQEDDLDWSDYLVRKMKEVHAEPLMFNGIVSGMKFEEGKYFTMFQMMNSY